LQRILTGLPKGFPLPVVIVQHISSGFLTGFVQWLSASSVIPLRIPCAGEKIKAGTAYVAPDGFHMEVQQGLVIMLSTLPPENGLRPSVDHLFRSVAQVVGKNAIGILLTGMGKDGAAELKEMRDMGAITIAQDEESSVIFGMPGEAFKIGAADHILPIDRIPEFLTELVKSKE
jgi:two-component system chemotaxis response regulator CheB